MLLKLRGKIIKANAYAELILRHILHVFVFGRFWYITTKEKGNRKSKFV